MGTKCSDRAMMISRIEFRVNRWNNERHIGDLLCRVHKRCLPSQKLEIVDTDNSKESIKACQDLQWKHDTSTPHHSETNGVAERAVRRVKKRRNYRTRAKRTTRRMVGPYDGMQLLLAQRWPMTRQSSRIYLVRNLTDHHSLGNTGWVHSDHREGQVKDPLVWTKNVESNMLGLSATCAVRMVRRLDDSRLWRFARNRRLRNRCQKIQKTTKCSWKSLMWKRNSKTSLPSQTFFDSRGGPRARRCWWNRRRRQKGKFNKRFVVHEWRFLSVDTRKNLDWSFTN